MGFTNADRAKGGRIVAEQLRAFTAPLRAKILRLRARGKSLAEISKKVGRSRERVRQIIRQEMGENG